MRAYRSTPSGKAAQARADSKDRAKAPEKEKARNEVTYALAIGRIVREPCFMCGANAQAHHASYAPDMRLLVTWLCPKHHKEAHAQRIAA